MTNYRIELHLTMADSLQTRDRNFNKMLSYRRETALQGAL